MAEQNPITDSKYAELEERVFSIFKHAAEEWLEDAAYQRLLRLAENPHLQLCVAYEEAPSFNVWQDSGLLAEDFTAGHYVQFSLFYVKVQDEHGAVVSDALEDSDLNFEEIAAKILLSLDSDDNEGIVNQWFPEKL